MEITDIRMNLLDNAGYVKAIGSFSLDNAFAVRGMRVVEDKNGRNFVAFPSRERANGEYEDIAFPLSKELYLEITDAIMKEFHRKQKEVAQEAQDKSHNQDESKGQEQTQVENNGKALEDASPELQNDEDVIEAAERGNEHDGDNLGDDFDDIGNDLGDDDPEDIGN